MKQLTTLISLSLYPFLVASAIDLDDVILVDFGLTVPTSGNYNVINGDSLTINDLVRSSDGANVGVSLDVFSANPFDNVSNVPSTAGLANINTNDDSVYEDGLLSVDPSGANNDTLSLTFSGLDDDLFYHVTGSLARGANGANFSSTWVVSGADSQISDGTPANGHVEFLSLSPIGGSITLTLTDNIRQCGLAQLALVATDIPPVSPPSSGLPNFTDLEFDGDDLLIELNAPMGNNLLQRTDDLVSFEAVSFVVEEDGDLNILRVEGAANIDPEANGRSFFRIARPPNFVMILTDDQGYQDLGCYGSPTVSSPRIDAMAAEGIRFTNFYAQTVCGPARDALMTGCYPLRTAHHPNIEDRTSPHSRLELSEITVAEILREQGYATSAFGKWDLEGRFEFASPSTHGPTGQGFDSYVMTVAGNSTATRVATDGAISFIESNQNQPFFTYVSYSMPHVELALSPEFNGFTGQGIYADVMAEIDDGVGRILDTIEAQGLSETTYVIFMSDNGPWYLGNSQVHIDRYGGSAEAEEMGGSALPLRGDKTTSWEGGFRVPSIMWAPGRIPAGQVSDEVATIMDVMPTLARLAGSSAPADRVIDGHDISPIIHGVPDAKSETEAFFYYIRETLHAVRVGKWKLHVPRESDEFWERFYRTGDYIEVTAPLLYDLENDIGETTDVSASHPEIVAELLEYIEFARNDIGDFNIIGENAR